MAEVTPILADIRSGKVAAAGLVPAVYRQLKRIAADPFFHEKPGHILQVTALVNEPYLRLFAGEEPPSWESRGHFFAAAAEAMRRILVDYARRRGSQKRGGGRKRVALADEHHGSEARIDEVLDVDHFLHKFAEH